MENPRVAVCYGTRPEWLKLRSVVRELEVLGVPVDIYLVTQHDTLLPKDHLADYYITVEETKTGRLGGIVSSVTKELKFKDECRVVVVQGDTATAFACALSAFQQSKAVAHVEAGLRSYDIFSPFPEEGYRKMITQISSLNFPPTPAAEWVIQDESPEAWTVMSGNTVLDNLREYSFDVVDGNVVVVTMHRKESREYGHIFADVILESLEPYGYDVKWVKHPGMQVFNEHISSLEKRYKCVEFVEPMGHWDFSKMVASCAFVVTDSGGLVEESSYYGKKSLVLRDGTERGEAVDAGYSMVLCAPSQDKGWMTQKFKEGLVFAQERDDNLVPGICPFGDGYAGRAIAREISEVIK